MSDRLFQYNHNHLRDLSLIGYIALMPVSAFSQSLSLIGILMVRYLIILRAVQLGNLERVHLLVGRLFESIKSQQIRKSKDINALIISGVLFGGIIWKHSSITMFAVEQGADVNTICPPFQSSTPLIMAVKVGDLEIIRYLLEGGADRDKAMEDGNTPLHCAAFYGHLEVVMLLMSYGADLNARNNDGRLPIDWARTVEVRQAIRDEQIRRIDHGLKRAVEQDWHPVADATQQEDDDDDESSDEDD